MDKKPLVSIVIPVYNGSNFLKEAIDSAIAQTYENKEIIVVNDGSKDEGKTEQIALSYGEKIRYIYKENGGVSSALNVGIKNMQGEYFSWLSHDDLYLPEKVEKQVNAICSTNKEKTLAVCGFKCINKEGQELSAINKQPLKAGYYSWNSVITQMLPMGCFNGCSLLIPKSAFDECGGFDDKLKYCQDFLMWMEMFLAGYGIVSLDEVLVCNRVHSGQLTQTGRALFHSDSEKISQIIAPKIAQLESNASEIMFAYAMRNAKLGNKAVVKNCLKFSKEKKLLRGTRRLKLLVAKVYGAVRPTIRKVYYKFFAKV